MTTCKPDTNTQGVPDLHLENANLDSALCLEDIGVDIALVLQKSTCLLLFDPEDLVFSELDIVLGEYPLGGI